MLPLVSDRVKRCHRYGDSAALCALCLLYNLCGLITGRAFSNPFPLFGARSGRWLACLMWHQLLWRRMDHSAVDVRTMMKPAETDK